MSDQEQPKQRSSVTPWVLWLLTVILALGAAFWAHEKLLAEQTSKAEAVTATELAVKKAAELTEGKRVAEARVATLEKERDELAAKANQLTTTLVQREEELARLTATSKSLEDKLAAEIKRGDVKVTQSEGRIQVDLVDKVLFESAKADVTARGEEVLMRLGTILASMDDRQIQISGHTDDSPITLPDLKAKFPSNWELSTARAVNVVRFLEEKAKVKPGRLLAAGYGQHKPIASNATPKGRAANRRIEILLLPPLQARKADLPAPTPPKEGAK